MAGRADSTEGQSEAGSSSLLESGETFDLTIFEQILEMDDDEDEREFSRSIVYGFFEQAESTFTQMETSLVERDLHQLSQLGHFLKGSSATLGLTKVKDSCEKIQHYGAHKDHTGCIDEPDDDVCLNAIRRTLAKVKTEYAEAERILRRFYQSGT